MANELSVICDVLNIDVYELINLSNQHPRVNILKPGCGVGGHCIAIDPWFIASACPEITELIQSARKVNNEKAEWVTKKILDEASILKNRIARKPKIFDISNIFSPEPAKAAIIAPTIITEEIAFVTDISGVCNDGVTLQTT